ASLEQLSAHPLAEALVHHAVRNGLALSFPEQVTEDPGRRLGSGLDRHRVAAGGSHWLRAHGHQLDGWTSPEGDEPGRATISVAVDGSPAGASRVGDEGQ